MERGFRFPNEEVAYGREAQRMPLPIGGNQMSAGGGRLSFPVLVYSLPVSGTCPRSAKFPVVFSSTAGAVQLKTAGNGRIQTLAGGHAGW